MISWKLMTAKFGIAHEKAVAAVKQPKEKD